jgi:hypothetical protein
MIKCNFCGYEFPEDQARTACSGCAMSKSCNKAKCPNCGYEILREPKLIKWMKGWGQKHEQAK